MEIKLKLKVRDVEIELTKDEARELNEALSGLLGKPKEVVREVWPWWPYTWRYTYPCDSGTWVSSSGNISFSVT